MKEFFCWCDADPNDTIIVEAEDELTACQKLIEKLGWCIGQGEETDETEDSEE